MGGALQEFDKWSRAVLFYDINGEGTESGTEVGYRKELWVGNWGEGGIWEGVWLQERILTWARAVEKGAGSGSGL